jgi:small subunit ribosomal protein S16
VNLHSFLLGLGRYSFFSIKKSHESMIRLRLKRFGKKREVSYRIVAMNNNSRRDGRPLEELGFYNPRSDEVKLNVPAIVKRLKEGAQPTDTVRSILEKEKVFEQLNA